MLTEDQMKSKWTTHPLRYQRFVTSKTICKGFF